MNNYCGQSVTLQNTLRFIPGPYPGSSTMENSRRYELDDAYVYLNSRFSNGSSTRHDIIQGAWSRRYLNQETAYATL